MCTITFRKTQHLVSSCRSKGWVCVLYVFTIKLYYAVDQQSNTMFLVLVLVKLIDFQKVLRRISYGVGRSHESRVTPLPIFGAKCKWKPIKRDKSTSRDFVARGRPLRGQTRLAPLTKRSTCSKSIKLTAQLIRAHTCCDTVSLNSHFNWCNLFFS